MQLKKKIFKEVLVFKINKISDKRGYFSETYNHKNLSKFFKCKFVLDAVSFNKKNVLRGIHFRNKHQQNKLIYVLAGKVLDFIVDLRKNSKTYLQYKKITLSDKNGKALFIPKGFGHGFYVLSNTALVAYKLSDYYYKKYEKIIRWNDEKIKIMLPRNLTKKIILSSKDCD